MPETDFSPGKYCQTGQGAIATQSPQASEAGVEMLRQGGNAIDAAVAAAMTLGVTEPQASGLGGQTMMLIEQQGKVIAVDGSSRAPSLAHPSGIYEHDRSLGYRATTVPSTPAVLWYVHQQYGSLPWAQVLEPAIHWAKQGYAISTLQSMLLERENDNFLQVKSQSGAYYFYRDKKPYARGDIFKQHDLAALLVNLAENGVQSFYQGKIAKQIDSDMRENGGLLRYDDLAMVPYPIEREALVRSFRSHDVYTMPPPGSGRTLLYSLMMLDWVPGDVLLADDLNKYLILAQLFRKALFERSDRPYNANFFTQIAHSADMLDTDFARESITRIINAIDKTILPIIPAEDELHGDTTHLSVMDNKGMAVSLTQSIERVYGSKAAAAGLGFLYNNYLYDFDYLLPEHPYYLRPNAVPWATVAPSMVFKDNTNWLVMGSPGSERIISTLLQFLSNLLDRGMDLYTAMTAPRLHCSLGGRISLEAGRFAPELPAFLQEKGFRIDVRNDYAFYLGCIQAVMHNANGYEATADVRRDGTAIGL